MNGKQAEQLDVLGTEKVAYWFFRLNGCLTIENFVVHQNFGTTPSSQRTDADVIGVRFPHRSEDRHRPMPDFPSLRCDRLLLFIAEVKLRKCKLNGPWTRPAEHNLEHVLSAIGFCAPQKLGLVAEDLYSTYRYQDECSEVRFYAVGDDGDELRRHRPGVETVTWRDIFGFVYDRFRAYEDVKRDHDQWDATGRLLFDLAVREPCREKFVEQGRARLQDGRGNSLVARTGMQP